MTLISQKICFEGVLKPENFPFVFYLKTSSHSSIVLFNRKTILLRIKLNRIYWNLRDLFIRTIYVGEQKILWKELYFLSGEILIPLAESNPSATSFTSSGLQQTTFAQCRFKYVSKYFKKGSEKQWSLVAQKWAGPTAMMSFTLKEKNSMGRKPKAQIRGLSYNWGRGFLREGKL